MPCIDEYLDILACPRCKEPFARVGGQLRCGRGHCFPIVHGVPDLRLSEAPYHARADEMVVVERLVKRARSKPYVELASEYYSGQETDSYTERSDVGVRWGLGVVSRGRVILERVDVFVQGAGLDPRHGVALDLGCGGGGALEALARSHERVIGLNISLAELMLARRFLQDHGLLEVCLVAAAAEALPFRGSSLGFVLMEDTIEHLADQKAALAEVLRILCPGGTLHMSSPNRHALLSPEGHVKLMWLGFLPRPLMHPYVRVRTGGSYRHIRLLGLEELSRMLDGLGPQARWQIFTPRLRSHASSISGRLYRSVARVSQGVADRIYLGLQPDFKVLLHRVRGSNAREP